MKKNGCGIQIGYVIDMKMNGCGIQIGYVIDLKMNGCGIIQVGYVIENGCGISLV